MLSSRSRYTDLADTNLCNLVKKLKTSDLFKAAKFNVLTASTASFEHEDFVVTEIKLIFLSFIDSFQYALDCILLYLIYNLVVIYCKSSFTFQSLI